MWSRRPLLKLLLPLPWVVRAGAATAADDTERQNAVSASATSGATAEATPPADFVQAARGAVRRDLFAKAADSAISVLDFMSIADARSIRDRRLEPERIDRITQALNACFAAACADDSGNGGRSVYLPDGSYHVGPLIFGDQAMRQQAKTPLALVGDSKNAARLVARPGLTGTLLASRSCAGVTFRDFSIDTRGSRAMAWDAEWCPGTGPSTQNIIEDIRIEGGNAPLHVNLVNLNDTFPTRLTVNASAADQCCIDFTQSGGLASLRDSIWNGGFLRFGAQNGIISNCWGFGIEFAPGCLNYIDIDGCYLYPNAAHGHLLWSGSFAPQQSVRSLTCRATQFIGRYETTTARAYLNLNAYSKTVLSGCQIIGPNIPLLGPDCRSDSYADVQLLIEGGSLTPVDGGRVQLDDRGRIVVIADGLMDDGTGHRVDKRWEGRFTPAAEGERSAGSATYSNRQGQWLRNGSALHLELRLTWSRHSGAGPLRITGLPRSATAGISAVTIGYAGGTFGGDMVQAVAGPDGIAFFRGATPVAVPASGDLILSWTVRSMA